jgi:hypothetical protein
MVGHDVELSARATATPNCGTGDARYRPRTSGMQFAKSDARWRPTFTAGQPARGSVVGHFAARHKTEGRERELLRPLVGDEASRAQALRVLTRGRESA